MKLLVVSDVHGDLDALERAVDAEADADAVIFLGDGLREAEDLQDMRPELKIYSVRGNCDYASFAPPDGLAAFGGVLFYYTHGNLYNVKNELDTLADAARARGADAALYGLPTVLAARSGAVWCFSTPARFPGCRGAAAMVWSWWKTARRVLSTDGFDTRLSRDKGERQL